MQIVMIIFGSFCLGFGIFATIFLSISSHRTKKIHSWKLTEGKIIKKDAHISISISNLINKEPAESTVPDRAPTVRFEVDGITYESTSTIQQKPGFRPGTIVELYYNPENPKETIINSFAQKGTLFKMIGWIFTCLTIGSIVVGLILLMLI